MGPAVLSFVERLSSFRGDFLYSESMACPLLGGLSFFRVSFIRVFTVIHRLVRDWLVFEYINLKPHLQEYEVPNPRREKLHHSKPHN